jgi:hypothetical protein
MNDSLFKNEGFYVSCITRLVPNIVKSKTNFSPRFVTSPLLWDMEEMYGTTKGPHQYSGAVGTIELDDFI